MEAPICFVAGGVRSGKTAFAEKLASEFAAGGSSPLFYLACGRAADREMEERIRRHKEERRTSGQEWSTGEYPTDIALAAEKMSSGAVILLDCLTTLLDNELFREPDFEMDREGQMGVLKKILADIGCLRRKAAAIVIVSNEVFQEPALPQGIVSSYRKVLGLLHQEIAAEAAAAFRMEAGIPLMMKEDPAGRWSIC